MHTHVLLVVVGLLTSLSPSCDVCVHMWGVATNVAQLASPQWEAGSCVCTHTPYFPHVYVDTIYVASGEVQIKFIRDLIEFTGVYANIASSFAINMHPSSIVWRRGHGPHHWLLCVYCCIFSHLATSHQLVYVAAPQTIEDHFSTKCTLTYKHAPSHWVLQENITRKPININT